MSAKKLTVACPGGGVVLSQFIYQHDYPREIACPTCTGVFPPGLQGILDIPGGKGTFRPVGVLPGASFHLVLPTHDIEVTLGVAPTKVDEDDLREVRIFLYDQGWLGEGRPHEELQRRLKYHQAHLGQVRIERSEAQAAAQKAERECAARREEAKTFRLALKNLAFLAMRVVTGDSVAPGSRLTEDAQVVWGILQRFRNDLDPERAVAKHREDELNRARQEAQTLRRERDGEVWIWQGDGSDDPASLTCPVLVEPEQVRAWVKAEKDLVRADAATDRMTLAASEAQTAAQKAEKVRDAMHELLRKTSTALRMASTALGACGDRHTGLKVYVDDLLKTGDGGELGEAIEYEEYRDALVAALQGRMREMQAVGKNLDALITALAGLSAAPAGGSEEK